MAVKPAFCSSTRNSGCTLAAKKVICDIPEGVSRTATILTVHDVWHALRAEPGMLMSLNRGRDQVLWHACCPKVRTIIDVPDELANDVKVIVRRFTNIRGKIV